jgi:hypothetical protein
MDEVEKLFEIIIELPRLTHKAIEIESESLLLVSQLLCAIDLGSVARVSHGRDNVGELLPERRSGLLDC